MLYISSAKHLKNIKINAADNKPVPYYCLIVNNLKHKAMPVLKTKEETKLMLEAKKGGVNKPIIFAAEIESLKKSESIFISTQEWAEKLKTSVSAYYWAKYSKGREVKTISISKVEGGHLITKL